MSTPPTVCIASEKSRENMDPPTYTMRTKGVADQDVQAFSRQLLRDEDDEDWGTLLSAAPRTLSSLGYCFATAWSKNADNIVQEKDKSIHRHLRSNLIDCSDLGREAFREAEIKMHQVSLTIRTIIEQDGTINAILESIEKGLEQIAKGDAVERTTLELVDKLHDLEQYANDCTKDSESVVQKFTTWQELATKINSAFTEAHEQEKEDLDKLKKKIEELSKELPQDYEQGTEEGRFEKLKQFFKRKKAERAVKKEQRAETPQVSQQLQNMSSMGATKDDVIDVLKKCLCHLTDLKGDLEDLHSFFRTLHHEIESINKSRVPKFIKLAGQSVNETTDATDNQFEELQREVLRLSGYYTRAGEKSTTYVQVSRRHIMPGVNKVNGLNKLDKDAIDEKVKLIAEYSKNAEEAIKDLAQERQHRRKLLVKSLGQPQS